MEHYLFILTQYSFTYVNITVTQINKNSYWHNHTALPKIKGQYE